MPFYPIPGMPGVGTSREATHRAICRGNWERLWPGGKVIDGAASRDAGNTPTTVLRAGLLMGKITATGKYAPSFVGAITAAYTSGGTTLAVTPAQAVELERLLGQAGTAEFVAVGPPTAAGTVAATAVTHSAINTTTGDITVTSLGVNKVAGTLLGVADGRQNPVTFIPDGWGMNVVDPITLASIDVPFPEFPVDADIVSTQLITWPADTSSQAFIVASLRNFGTFRFSHLYNA